MLIVAARLQGFDRASSGPPRTSGATTGDGPSATSSCRSSRPAILAGALISVTLSIDEFVITFFTVGPQTTLPTYIYTQIKFGVTPEVNAVATVMLVATLAAPGRGLRGILVAAAALRGRLRRAPGGGRLMRAAVFKGDGAARHRGRTRADRRRPPTT